MKFVKLLLLIFISVSCSTSNEDIAFEYVILDPKEKHEFDSDEYFLSNMWHMDFNQGTYILAETEYNRITLLNKDHTVKATIAQEGNYLTDPNFPMIIHASEGEFAAFMAENRIRFYNYEGEYQSSYVLKSATSGIEGFSVSNKNIFYSDENGISPYVKVNLQTDEVKNIGQFHPDHTTKFAKIYKSLGQIFELDDQRFVTVLSAMGEVILYNSDSEILSKFNINEIDELKTTARLLEEANADKNSNSVRMVFEDSKLRGNKLYILAIQDKEPETGNQRNYTQNHIIQLKIEKDNSFKVERLYKLNGARIFNTFAVADDNTLTVSHPTENQLWTYELR
tara:strand:+ start:214 stop:1227 length:1014 start_codon:yes stop_codon:yes gene_type:complete